MVVRALTAPYSRGCSTAGKESRLPRRDDCQSISSLDDATLLAKAKAGDPAAFAWLYERHVADALRYARSCHIGESAARDLVTESFMRVLGALRRGCGPMTVLWPYLAATMRSVAYERSHEATPSARGIFCGGENFDRAEAPECDLIRRAFASLPSRWQYLLWRVDVEGEPVAAVGRDLALSPRASAALTRQARAALDGAYLREHFHACAQANTRVDVVATWWANARQRMFRVGEWIVKPRRWLPGHLRQWFASRVWQGRRPERGRRRFEPSASGRRLARR